MYIYDNQLEKECKTERRGRLGDDRWRTLTLAKDFCHELNNGFIYINIIV